MQSTATPSDPKAFKSFSEFYPFYLTEHSNRTCRRLHFVGTSLSLVCLAMLIATGKPQYLLYGLLCGYGSAWVGHFCFEKNGVLADVNDEQSVILKITPESYGELKARGIIADGMLPKLENAFDALRFGVEKVIIEHALHINGESKTTLCLTQ